MENASKALVMAGSVLIALMIIGALILMFNNLFSYQQTNQTDKRTDQTIEFNNQFETYNREDVRGSELYSLLNRAIDYNRKNLTEGTGFTTIKVTFTFGGKLSEIASPSGNKLITKDKYEQSGIKNDFDDNIKSTINYLEGKYGATSLTSLTTGLSKIFIDTETESKKIEAVNLFNTVSKKIKVTNWNEIKKGSSIREEVYKYYEYVQFKRAHFNCTSLDGKGKSGVTYDSNTGRIIEMNFVFNGKIE